MRKVEVLPYQRDWMLKFNDEAGQLKRIFGPELLNIYHIGSTSIPKLVAKPIIDIMPVVKNIQIVDQFNESMEKIGYESMGEFGIPGRRYFRKGGDHRTHHVHIFPVGSSHIVRHLAFRDYLRHHPNERKRYGELKLYLAKKFPADIDGYINGKDQFVKETEAKALEWYKKIRADKNLDAD